MHPGPETIRAHVGRLRRGNEENAIEARVTYETQRGALITFAATFGRYAVFASGDLAFESQPDPQRTVTNGILIARGNTFYLSQADKGRLSN